MRVKKRIIAFAKLGKVLEKETQGHLLQFIRKAEKYNPWFTEENIRFSISAISKMLEEKKLEKWVAMYPSLDSSPSVVRQVGVIMAGNVPLVGFHDFLCVLISGNSFVGKLSSDDKFLLPAIAEILFEIEPEFKNKVVFHSSASPFKTKEIAAYIATGSNNSARYFEYYFRNYPHIIRRNRNSVAILDGSETDEELKNLGKDIFQYFGLGCRNVSKIFIPANYELNKFFSAIVDFGDVIHHNKYFNNYHYYRSIYLINKEKFLDNNFLLLKESKQTASPVANLFYERYKTQQELSERLHEEAKNIQCIVSKQRVAFGRSQMPELWDYADGVDTMKFLLDLSMSESRQH